MEVNGPKPNLLGGEDHRLNAGATGCVGRRWNNSR